MFGYLFLTVVLLWGVLILVNSLAVYVPTMLGRGAAANDELTAKALEDSLGQNVRFAAFGIAGLVLLPCAGRGRSVGASFDPRRAGTWWAGVVRLAVWTACCLVGMLTVSRSRAG
ncbi:MAG: hypothetical protein AAGC66_00030 [Leifsonia sp.]